MQSLLGSQFIYMGVFCDDFAAVDFREELCYHGRPKKTNPKVLITDFRVQKYSVISLEALHPYFTVNYKI